jgi:hypothetical protein
MQESAFNHNRPRFCCLIAAKIGCTAQILHQREGRDGRWRACDMAEGLMALERENRQRRQGNEVLPKR